MTPPPGLRDVPPSRVHDSPKDVWLSGVTQPCEICDKLTRWRVHVSITSRFKFGHPYICSEKCLFALRLEGKW